MSGAPSADFCIERASAILVKTPNKPREALAWAALAIAIRLSEKDIVEAVAIAAEDFVRHPSEQAHGVLFNMLGAWRGKPPVENDGPDHS